MKTETSKATGNLIVSEDTTFHHLFATEVKVEANVVARLFGNISDKLQVEKNAVVYLHGR